MNLQNSTVPPSRVRVCNELPVNSDGHYIVYWMIASRRERHNFALERAVEWAKQHHDLWYEEVKDQATTDTGDEGAAKLRDQPAS